MNASRVPESTAVANRLSRRVCAWRIWRRRSCAWSARLLAAAYKAETFTNPATSSRFAKVGRGPAFLVNLFLSARPSQPGVQRLP